MVKTTVCKILILLLFFVLSACSSKEVVYIDKPVEVMVPVYKNIAIKPVNKPILPVNKLSESSTPQEVAEAYYNSLKTMCIYSSKLEKLLAPFYLEYEVQHGIKRN